MSNERVGEVSLDIKLQANTGDFQKEIEQMVENTNRTLEGLDASDIKNKLEELKNSLNSFSQNVEKSMQEIQGSFNSLGLSKDVIDSYTKMASVFNELANNKFFDSLGEASNLLKQNFSVLSEQMENFSKEKINTSNQTTGLADVKTAVDDICEAISKKNESFTKEVGVVEEASSKEIDSLQKVLSKVEEIGKAVEKVDFKNWGQVPSPSAPTPSSGSSGSSSSSSTSNENSQNNLRNQREEQRRVNAEILAIDEADRQADQFRQQGLEQEAAIIQRNREYLQVWEQIPQAIENARSRMQQYQNDSAYSVNPQGLENASRWITQWTESLDQGRISLGTFQERVDQLFSKLESDTHKLGQLDKINQVLDKISNHKFADILSTDPAALIESLSELTELINMGLDDSSFETELERINSVLSESIDQLTNLETAADNAFGVLSNTEDKYQKLLYKRGGTDAEGGRDGNLTARELDEWLTISQRRADAERDIAAAEERGISLVQQRNAYENQRLQIQQRINAISNANRTDPIIQAYKTLTNSEEKYQELIRKRGDTDSNLTNAEIRQLAKLQQSRDRANEVLSQVTVLTREQNEAYEEYNRVVQLAAEVTNRLNQAESERNLRKYGARLGNIDSESAASSFISQQIQSQGWTQLSNISRKVSRNGSIDYSVQVKNANKELQKMVYHLESAADGSYTVYENITTTTHASTLWEKIVGSLEGKFKALATYLASFATVQQLWTWIKTGAGYVKELNTQLTEMRKVSDESIRTLKNYQKETFAIADAVGTTAAQIQSSTADYLRLGESMSSAAELAKNTNILMNVSEFESIEKATESMIAMKQAYGELGSMDIIDKLNLAGNNFPISTSELAESLQRSAAALKVAGNDINEAIALTVAGNSILQDPDSVASGLRTISMRLTGTTASELTAIGEDTEGLIETTSKLRDTIRSLTAVNGKMGVSITDSVGKYKSTFEILSEIADRWEDIAKQDAIDGKNRQNAIMESVAGKNRAAIFAAIMQSPELLKQAYEEVQDASGSAQKELDTYLESTEAHLKKLTNSVQEMWDTTLNSDFLNFFIDLGTIVTNLTTKAGGLIPVASAFVGIIGSLAKNVGGENCYPSRNMPTCICSSSKGLGLNIQLASAS